MKDFLSEKKYIDLDTLYPEEYLENQYKGKGCPFIIDGEEYFLRKITNEKTFYKELLAEEILKCLGYSCIDYSLVKLFDQPFLISKSFYREDLNIIKGYELLEQYNSNRNYDSDYINNIDMIKKAFLERYKLDESNIIYQQFMSQLYSLFCFDILFGNNDRKSDNWVIQEHIYKRYDGKMICDEVRLGPIFDNEMIFEDNGRDFAMGLNYQDMTSANNDFNSIKSKILDDQTFFSILRYMKEKITEDVFIYCLSKVEVKLECNIPKEIRNDLLEQYHSRFEQLEKIMLNSGFKK